MSKIECSLSLYQGVFKSMDLKCVHELKRQYVFDSNLEYIGFE